MREGRRDKKEALAMLYDKTKQLKQNAKMREGALYFHAVCVQQ